MFQKGVKALLGVVLIGSIVIGSSLLEKRFETVGNISAAKTARSFTKFFLIGAGCFVVYSWIGAAMHLVLLH